MPESIADANPRWDIYTRDHLGNRFGMLTRYTSVDLIARYSDVGTYKIEVPIDEPLWPDLVTPGVGLEFVRDGETFLDGMLTTKERTKDATSDGFTFGGVSDEFWLKARFIHPQPLTPSPPYSADYSDDFVGPASSWMIYYVDRNAGPSALAARRVPGLTMAADPAIGGTTWAGGRFQNLLDLLQTVPRVHGIGFRIRGLEFQTFEPEDKTDTIVFSEGLGNLISHRYSQEVPQSDYAFVLGSGAGTAQIVVERSTSSDVASWGRIETIVNQTSTADVNELNQAGDDRLMQDGGRVAANLTGRDLPQMAFGVDYSLGDRVTAVLDTVTIADVITEVHATLGADGERVVPGVGSAEVMRKFQLFNRLARMDARLRAVERL